MIWTTQKMSWGIRTKGVKSITCKPDTWMRRVNCVPSWIKHFVEPCRRANQETAAIGRLSAGLRGCDKELKVSDRNASVSRPVCNLPFQPGCAPETDAAPRETWPPKRHSHQLGANSRGSLDWARHTLDMHTCFIGSWKLKHGNSRTALSLIAAQLMSRFPKLRSNGLPSVGLNR